MRKCVLVLMCAGAVACAPKVAPQLPSLEAGNTPQFADFVRPEMPSAFANTPASAVLDRGWMLLQAGDLRSAKRQLVTALGTTPTFYPAEIALGYVALAEHNPGDALPYFDRAIRWDAADRSALVGRGLALVALNRDRDALETFEAALAVDSSLGEIARRVDVLRFRMQEQTLAQARAAARGGRFDEAIARYGEAIAGSPDSGFLYRELADVERRTGNIDRAIESFGRAAALDPRDGTALTAIGELLESRNDLDGAMKAYRAAFAADPIPEVEDRLEALYSRVESARLPNQYWAIVRSPALTRGELAALIGVRLSGLLATDRRPVLVTDVRGSWAAAWIIAVTRAGVMEPFASHAFQPRAVVRRMELAQTVSRLLAQIAPPGSSQARSWESMQPRFSDLSMNHLAYTAVSLAVASGVMMNGSRDTFEPTRAVTGREAIEVIARLELLAGARATPKAAR